MTRPLRLQFAGANYHVFNRGNARQRVFLDDADYGAFLDIVGETCIDFGWRCPVHCLMPNHFHLMLRTAAPNLARGMRHLAGVFTQRYNKRHRRVGHLFQGRYKSLLVESGQYMTTLARYIVLNPVRAGIVTQPGDWRWSAHDWLTARRSAPAWADPTPVLQVLGADPASAARAFQHHLGVDDPDADARARDQGAGVLGSASFRGEQSLRLAQHRADRAFTVAARNADRPSLGALFGPREDCCAGAVRDAAMLEAVGSWGYTQTEIAAHLGFHPASVSRLLTRARMLRGRT